MFETSAPYKFAGLRLPGSASREMDAAQSADKRAARNLLDSGAKKVVSELADQPAVQAALMDSIGNVYIAFGAIEQAELLLNSALEIRQKLYPGSHVDTATSLYSLGMLHVMQNKVDARKPLRLSLAMRQKLLAADHEDVIKTKFALAFLDLLQQQSSQDTENWMQECVSWSEKRFGRQHPETGFAMIGLAAEISYRRTGDEPAQLHASAVSLLTKATAIFLKQPETRPFGLGLGESYQAFFLGRAGQPAKAAEMSAKAIAHFRQIDGAEAHPLFATQAMAHLNNLQRSGQNRQVKEFCRDVLSRFGDSHARLNLVCVYHLVRVLAKSPDPLELEEADQLCGKWIKRIRRLGSVIASRVLSNLE